LPFHDSIGLEVANIHAAGGRGFVVLKYNPAHMSIEKPLLYTIRILVGINIAMMGAVIPGPLFDVVLPCTSTKQRKHKS
jgi:hypothetical protein